MIRKQLIFQEQKNIDKSYSALVHPKTNGSTPNFHRVDQKSPGNVLGKNNFGKFKLISREMKTKYFFKNNILEFLLIIACVPCPSRISLAIHDASGLFNLEIQED